MEEIKFKDKIKTDFILYYMICSPTMLFIQTIIYYNHPEYGFSQFGTGIFLTVLFPLIWILIYLFCKYIEMQNEKIELLKNESDKKEEVNQQ